MTTAHTRNISDILDESPQTDNTAVFNHLLNVREQAWNMVQSSLDLREDQAGADLRDLRDLQGESSGEMTTFTGNTSPVDWLIRSWIGKPVTGFTNIHLTSWLKPMVDVPHLGFALGTVPDVFFYCDLIPRADLPAAPEYQEKYLAPLNEAWIKLRRDPAVTVFNPVHLYTRSTLSPVALCGVIPFPVFKDKVESAMLHYVRYWVDLVKNATPVPTEQQPALQARDEFVRRTIVEKDPANHLADRMFGAPMRERLVRILWGAERENQ